MCSVELLSNVDLNSVTNQNIFVDTNVLLWAFYPNLVSKSQNYSIYANALFGLINGHNNIYVLGNNLSEFVYVIEKTELCIYRKLKGLSKTFRLKDFRKISDERVKVQSVTQLALEQIFNIPEIKIVGCSNDPISIKNFINSYNSQQFDYYDYLTAQQCLKLSGVIITDDIDYKYSNLDLHIYTENSNYFGD